VFQQQLQKRYALFLRYYLTLGAILYFKITSVGT